MDRELRNILIGVSLVFAGMCLTVHLLISTVWPWNKNMIKRDVCGMVVEKFRTDAGYKSSPEAHVVFYCDSLRRNIDVKVTWNTLANATIGRPICFTLSTAEINY